MWDLWLTKWHWDRFFPCQFHSTGAPLLRKGQEIIIIIMIVTFFTGLHNNPQGCGASVASAAGPFTTNNKQGRVFKVFASLRVFSERGAERLKLPFCLSIMS
jgi:hypothetical protein